MYVKVSPLPLTEDQGVIGVLCKTCRPTVYCKYMYAGEAECGGEVKQRNEALVLLSAIINE